DVNDFDETQPGRFEWDAWADGHAEWLVGGNRLRLRRALVEDVGPAELREHIRQLRLPAPRRVTSSRGGEQWLA
ncbi:MAG: hypothetical protein ACXV3A_04835, partial [Kineosporiaceae bacterium]